MSEELVKIWNKMIEEYEENNYINEKYSKSTEKFCLYYGYIKALWNNNIIGEKEYINFILEINDICNKN